MIESSHLHTPLTHSRGGGASVAKTLDLLKAVLQSSFNMEIKRLCDDYLHIFSLAATNIHENTGDSVPEATLKLLVCKMMEEVRTGARVCCFGMLSLQQLDLHANTLKPVSIVVTSISVSVPRLNKAM